MGNYNSIESDFIQRTLAIIDQYDKEMVKYKFEE